MMSACELQGRRLINRPVRRLDGKISNCLPIMKGWIHGPPLLAAPRGSERQVEIPSVPTSDLNRQPFWRGTMAAKLSRISTAPEAGSFTLTLIA
jgi:hypothetical protein